MNKEEILAKSRQEENDEMEQHMESEGLRKGYAIFCVIFICPFVIHERKKDFKNFFEFIWRC